MRHTFPAPPLIWHSYLLCAIAGLFAPFLLAPSLAVLFLLLFFRANLHTPARILFALAIFASCACAIFIYLEYNPTFSTPNWAARPKARICGIVAECQPLAEKRLRVILKDLKSGDMAETAPLPGLCAWTWENAPLLSPLPGQKVCVSGRLRREGSFARNSREKAPSPTPEIKWRIWSDGQKGQPDITGQSLWAFRLRQAVFLRVAELMAPEEKPDASLPKLSQGQAIIMAILFGDRRFLSLQNLNSFGDASIAHSLALSGQHLGVAGLLGCFMAFLIGKFAPGAFLWRPRPSIIALLSIVPALLYLWIGGAPPSLTRAFGMLVFFAILACFGKIHSLMDLLMLTLLAILALRPLAIYNVGLQMSVLCIAVIFLTAPALARAGSRMFPPPATWKKTILKRITQIFLISLCIQLALLPTGLGWFQQPGAWFPLNILWLPVLGLFILPLAFLGFLLATPGISSLNWLASVFFKLAAIPCDWLLSLLEYLKQKGAFNLPLFISPHWTVYIAFGLALAGCAIIWSKPRSQRKSPEALKLIAASLAFLCIAPAMRIYHYLQNDLTIEALDVGQAQALRIRFPHNGEIILDGGGSKSIRFDPGKNIITPSLTANSKPKLSAIVSSHPDLDHAGGLIYLEDKFRPKYFFHNGRSANGGLEEKWEKVMAAKNAAVLAEGDELVLGDPENELSLEVLHPPRGAAENWQGNSASLVMRLVKNGEGLALFTGDAEKGVLKHLVESGKDLRAKILVAPHHGSDRSLYAPFYNRVKPEIVIASCGYENRWNYPGKKLRKFLQQKNIPLLDTGNSGKITVELENRLAIQTAENGAFTFDKKDKTQ